MSCPCNAQCSKITVMPRNSWMPVWCGWWSRQRQVWLQFSRRDLTYSIIFIDTFGLLILEPDQLNRMKSSFMSFSSYVEFFFSHSLSSRAPTALHGSVWPETANVPMQGTISRNPAAVQFFMHPSAITGQLLRQLVYHVLLIWKTLISPRLEKRSRLCESGRADWRAWAWREHSGKGKLDFG